MNMNIICMEHSQTYAKNLATLWLSTGPDQSIFLAFKFHTLLCQFRGNCLNTEEP